MKELITILSLSAAVVTDINPPDAQRLLAKLHNERKPYPVFIESYEPVTGIYMWANKTTNGVMPKVAITWTTNDSLVFLVVQTQFQTNTVLVERLR